MEKRVVIENNTAFQAARFEAIKRRQSWYIPCWEDGRGNGFYIEGVKENVTEDDENRSWEVKLPIEGRCEGCILETGAVTRATIHGSRDGVKID